jgi:hypothetical protein
LRTSRAKRRRAEGKFVTAVTGGMWDEVLAAIEKANR